MGWWATNVMGGDSPSDGISEVFNFLKIKLEQFEDKEDEYYFDEAVLNRLQPLLEAKQTKVLKYVKSLHDPEYQKYSIHALGFLLLKTGCNIDEKVKKEIISAIEADDWDEPSRIQHMNIFKEAINNSQPGVKVDLEDKSVYEVMMEDSKPESGLINITKKPFKKFDKDGKEIVPEEEAFYTFTYRDLKLVYTYTTDIATDKESEKGIVNVIRFLVFIVDGETTGFDSFIAHIPEFAYLSYQQFVFKVISSEDDFRQDFDMFLAFEGDNCSKMEDEEISYQSGGTKSFPAFVIYDLDNVEVNYYACKKDNEKLEKERQRQIKKAERLKNKQKETV